jgi:uncharacterized SAM-binding protein YcdF (DUF218 family)
MDGTCLILGAACLAYYALIAVYAGPSANFAWFWILLSAAFLGIAYLGKNQLFPLLRKVLLFGTSAGICLILILSIPVLRGLKGSARKDADYAVVLGAQVKGTLPSKALKKRLDRAYSWAQEYPDGILILSGGQGGGEDISEARCMWNDLTERGIATERLVMEDRSVTTRENLLFADQLTGCSKKRCGIISNNFHICRALMLAEKLGYEDPVGIPAASDPLMQLHYIVREAAALAASFLRGAI